MVNKKIEVTQCNMFWYVDDNNLSPKKSSSDLKHNRLNKETFWRFDCCERKQTHLPMDEHWNKEQCNTHWHGQTTEGIYNNVWIRCQYISLIPINKIIIWSEVRCRTTKWQERISIPISSGKNIFCYEKVHIRFRERSWFLNN